MAVRAIDFFYTVLMFSREAPVAQPITNWVTRRCYAYVGEFFEDPFVEEVGQIVIPSLYRDWTALWLRIEREV